MSGLCHPAYKLTFAESPSLGDSLLQRNSGLTV